MGSGKSDPPSLLLSPANTLSKRLFSVVFLPCGCERALRGALTLKSVLKGPGARAINIPSRSKSIPSLRLLNALNSEHRGLKMRFSLATIAFDRESAQMSQIILSQGKTRLQTPILTI